MNDLVKKVPVWFWVISGIALLWNLMGVNAFIQQMSISAETLEAMSTEESDLYSSIPIWAKIAFAIGVFGGVLGSLGLLLRKKWAKLLLLLSLLGIAIHMTYNVFISTALEVYGSGALYIPIVLIVFAIFILWFAKYSIKKSWLK